MKREISVWICDACGEHAESRLSRPEGWAVLQVYTEPARIIERDLCSHCVDVTSEALGDLQIPAPEEEDTFRTRKDHEHAEIPKARPGRSRTVD